VKQTITRRTFWRRALGLGALGYFVSKLPAQNNPSAASAPRKRLPNPFMEKGKPIVMVVHGTDFTAMLKKGMEVLGGFDRFGKNKAVHIKPNFVAADPYPETTDGNSILATIELLKKDGFDDITVAEWGSAMGMWQASTEGFKYYGLDRKAESGGFKIKDLINDETVQVKDKQWIAMPSVGVRKSVYEIPLIINMPTLKQHSLIPLSCALKNIMGQIDKQSRDNLHREGTSFMPDNPNTRYKRSYLALAEIAAAVNPELTIIDARAGLGRSHRINMGGVSIKPKRIIISGDALAADLVAAEVLEESYQGFQAEMAQSLFQHASTLGFGAKTIDDVVMKEASV
jgi:uncharacterized protein (DUF362 family)